MANFQPANPDFEARVRDSFERQNFMTTISATLGKVTAGETEITVPYAPGLCQQHGLFHGGVIGTIADNACGYAAFTLMPAENSVLTVEYKLNIMAPAEGEMLLARGRVVRPGRRVTVCQGDVYVVRDGVEKLCATALGTFISLANTSDHALEERAA
jgi:uncharacterized protein (TIGR00369 family)